MNKKKVIFVLVGVIIAVVLLTYINQHGKSNYIDDYGYEHEVDKVDVWSNTNESKDLEYALIKIDKNELLGMSEHSFINKILPILEAYNDKQYTTLIFYDGTGICFPYSSLDYVAAYGKVDEKGNVIDEEGTISINGSQVVYMPINASISAQTNDIYSYIPEKYFSDDLAACRDENSLYIAFSMSVMEGAEDAVVESFLKDFSGYKINDLDSFIVVLNKSNGYVINPVSRNITRDDSVIQSALNKVGME